MRVDERSGGAGNVSWRAGLKALTLVVGAQLVLSQTGLCQVGFENPLQQLLPGAGSPGFGAPSLPLVEKMLPGTFEEEDCIVAKRASGASDEAIKSALLPLGAKVIDQLQFPSFTFLKIFVGRFRVDEAMVRLSNDPNFKDVERNEVYESAASDDGPNDMVYKAEWHLFTMNVPEAWEHTTGEGVTVGVLDSGCNIATPELAGRAIPGFDAVTDTEGLTTDPLFTVRRPADLQRLPKQGHGTMVATTLAANTDNLLNTAAPAHGSTIFPVRIMENDKSSKAMMIAGIKKCMDKGIKIINMSVGPHAPSSLADPNGRQDLHDALKDYHDVSGGLAFACMQNDGQHVDAGLDKPLPYMIMVSSLTYGRKLAQHSNFGNPVWFACPGAFIWFTRGNGLPVCGKGTSFATPLCASVAALVWSANPGLTNTQVEQIMKDTAQKTVDDNGNTIEHSQQFGFGVPDAGAAVKRAKGIS